MAKAKFLVIKHPVPEHPELRGALQADFALIFAPTRNAALAFVRRRGPVLASLDLRRRPPGHSPADGLATLEAILTLAPSSKVVVVTDKDDVATTVAATRLGAFDYHPAPLDLEAFTLTLRRALALQAPENGDGNRGHVDDGRPIFEGMLGNAPTMRQVFATISRVAKGNTTLLIHGETGTGKELVARAIHAQSERRDQPFVPIDCGAIPDTLLEVELFGHEKGAYTGAHISRRGLFEMADGGTAFLDEIGELSLPLQVKLLRFLQEREVGRVGARDRVKVDVRVIAATNRNLGAEVQAGRFRNDLYYRIAVVLLKLPPLRERGEDPILLANVFLQRYCREQRRRLRFDEEALAAIKRHPWPGNVRELQNAIERATLLADGPRIGPSDLGIAPAPALRLPSWTEARSAAARETLVNALARTAGNVSHAARALGISRPMLYEVLQRYGVTAKDFRRTAVGRNGASSLSQSSKARGVEQSRHFS